MRGVVRALSLAAGLAGIVLLAFPAGLRLLQDRGTEAAQSRLEAEFVAVANDVPVILDVPTRGESGDASAEDPTILASRPRLGAALGRITIPDIGLRMMVVEGTNPAQLEQGPGRYRATAMLCSEGNAAIAGHRTTYLAPFNRLDELRPGDAILIDTPFGRCRYEVVRSFQVLPTDGHVLGDVGYGALTLTTCTPEGSSAFRLVVRARLVG